MEDLQKTTNELVEILKKLNRPASSPEVAAIWEKEHGERINPTKVYRCFQRVSGTGQVSQDKKRRWEIGLGVEILELTKSTKTATTTTTTDDNMIRNAKNAANLFKEVVKALESDPPDIIMYRINKRAAEMLMGG
jgi:hypothetical protein